MVKFIDYDKQEGVFFDNLWLEECKTVLKQPLTKKSLSNEDFRLEDFNLSRYTYLLHYD